MRTLRTRVFAMLFYGLSILLAATGCDKNPTESKGPTTPPVFTLVKIDTLIDWGKGYKPFKGYASFFSIKDVTGNVGIFYFPDRMWGWYWEGAPIMFPPVDPQKWQYYPVRTDMGTKPEDRKPAYQVNITFNGKFSAGILYVFSASNEIGTSYVSGIVNTDGTLSALEGDLRGKYPPSKFLKEGGALNKVEPETWEFDEVDWKR